MLQATLCFSSYFLRTNIPEQFYGPLASCPSLPSPLSLLSAFFFPQVLHSCALLGSFVFCGKPSTQPFPWKLFIGLFLLPSTWGECEKKQRKYSTNAKEGRSFTVSCSGFQRMHFLPGLFAKAVLVHNPCWLSPQGRKVEGAAGCSPLFLLPQMLSNTVSLYHYTQPMYIQSMLHSFRKRKQRQYPHLPEWTLLLGFSN